jgi:cobalamin synthase
MDQQNLPGTIRHEVSISEWMVTLLITFLPLIGLIMLFVWAFGDGTNPSKKNWAIATLIWFAISIVLAILFFVIFGAIFASMFGGMNSYS